MQSLNLKSEEFVGKTRNFERYPVEVPARVELLRSRRKDRVLFLKTCNLSALGAFFPQWQSISTGSIIKAEFYLYFENHDNVEAIHDVVVITVKGKVVRSDRFGTAVSFVEDYQMETYPGSILGRKWT